MAEPLTREAIVAATRDLIRRDGLDAVSVRRVAAALGVTAPALYAYMRNKRDVLATIADEEFAVLIERFREVDDADPLVRTRGYCRAFIDHALENPELFKVMFEFRPRLGFGERGAELPAATDAFELPVAALEEAIAAGRLRETDPLLATFATWAAIQGTADVLLMEFDFDASFRERLIESAIDMVIRGISA
jgi:AcrR family transcriptional regulator